MRARVSSFVACVAVFTLATPLATRVATLASTAAPHGAGVPQASVSAESCDATGLESPAQACGRAPDASDLVIVIDNAAGLATTPAGRGALRVLEDVGLFSGTSVAWAELAAALGMSPEAALEAMAGSRTMLVAANETAERPAAWALLTEVSAQTERLIRERLKPVPRQIVDGQPVLMLENGRFLLATRRAPNKATRGKPSEGLATVLIASADAPTLFNACLPLLSGMRAPNALGDDARAGPLLVEQPSDAFILYRGRENDEPDAPRTLAALSVWATESGWRASIACDAGLLGEPADVARAAIPGSLFAAITGGPAGEAIVAFAAPISNTRDAGSGFSRFLFRFLSDVAPLFDGAGIVAIRERAADGAKANADLFIGANIRDEDDVAGAIDAGMAAVINRMARAPTGLAEAQDFGGHFPSAVREATLSSRALSALAPLIGPTPVVRWCGSGMDPGSPDAAPRWWLASITDIQAPSGAATLRSVAASLAPEPAQDGDAAPEPPAEAPRSWTTIGVIRPSRALEVAPPVLVTLLRSFEPLRWVRQVSWQGAMAESGLVRGEATLEFEPHALRAPDPGK